MKRLTDMNALEQIAFEREQQVLAGYTAEHDDKHTLGELSDAAACYAAGLPTYAPTGAILPDAADAAGFAPLWPWPDLKPPMRGPAGEELENDPRIRQLVIAGALIVAEIERLHRAQGVADAR